MLVGNRLGGPARRRNKAAAGGHRFGGLGDGSAGGIVDGFRSGDAIDGIGHDPDPARAGAGLERRIGRQFGVDRRARLGGCRLAGRLEPEASGGGAAVSKGARSTGSIDGTSGATGATGGAVRGASVTTGGAGGVAGFAAGAGRGAAAAVGRAASRCPSSKLARRSTTCSMVP